MTQVSIASRRRVERRLLKCWLHRDGGVKRMVCIGEDG